MTDRQRNIANVKAFYSMAFNDCEPAKAMKLYSGDRYVQHNPLVGDGKQPFIDYFERMAREHPDKRLEIKRELADGDFVILHCYQDWPATASSEREEYAGIDIFRCDENGKVVEHWDVLQLIPPTAEHDNGMF
ncbi:nuclear transport factor 2 family protein [Qipengyuania sp. 1NDH17]|uniref:Nuclear transport factor 2 family protein n=1 Tax=Qipengyuania polymorpha TaxID=2867234 RepID=A0ABS7J154_9SPHN|nr:nuclear transport factor 2 family protein [Qipengyuania polymorpha]MBX7458201.1 nuclear transport factor 2 family protein [Qipengyuania polymorpha]